MAEEMIRKGPKAVIECTEDIPCNPCSTCCRFGAITIKGSISELPCLDEEKCTGCGLCIPACPGMAIFVVDEHYTDTEALVSFPYEFLPMPVKGQAVKATDRKGSIVCDGEIQKVVISDKFDHTAVVTVKIPCEFASAVRGIKRLKKGE